MTDSVNRVELDEADTKIFKEFLGLAGEAIDNYKNPDFNANDLYKKAEKLGRQLEDNLGKKDAEIGEKIHSLFDGFKNNNLDKIVVVAYQTMIDMRLTSSALFHMCGVDGAREAGEKILLLFKNLRLGVAVYRDALKYKFDTVAEMYKEFLEEFSDVTEAYYEICASMPKITVEAFEFASESKKKGWLSYSEDDYNMVAL